MNHAYMQVTQAQASSPISGCLSVRAYFPVCLCMVLIALCAHLTPALAAGTPPTITPIANQLINMGTSTSVLAFTVSDKITPAASLIVTGSTSNTTLLPATGIVLVKPNSAGLCSVTLTPKSVYSGVTTILITVKDSSGLTANTSFTLTVNHPPTITTIANQSTYEGLSTSALTFTVGDDLTPVGSLTMTGTSSNTSLVPLAKLAFGGSGAARTVTVTPVAGNIGTATITLSVKDGGGLTTTTSFVLTVKVPPPPTITTLANQLITMGTSTAALAFTIGNTGYPASSLTVTCASSNTALLPTTGIVLVGPNASGLCTVTLTPKSVYCGVTTMTLTVTNGYGLTAKTSFTLTVNHPPTITAIANQIIHVGKSTSALAFTVGDTVTPVASLTVTGLAANALLVPTANIVFSGTGAARTVTVTPASGHSGATSIIVTVTDGNGASASTSFLLTVHGPTITPIANQLINLNASTAALLFTVGDDVTLAASLAVTATASNSTLFPSCRIVLGGSGAARTLTVTPGAGQSGSATLTLTVKDSSSITASTSFMLTVNAPPTITAIADQHTTMGTSTPALAFTVGDDLTPLSSLKVAAVSSNTALVKSAGIVLTGPDDQGHCTVTVTPVATYSGMTTITLTTTDGGGLKTMTSFPVNVTTVNNGTNSTDGATMVWVPGGSFTMGCPSAIDNGLASKGETQQVTLSGYWIYTNEVTVAQYRKFCAAMGYALPVYPSVANGYPSLTPWLLNSDWTGTVGNLQQTPIVNVAWTDAKAYCAWAKVQLPTEAQYEYAARGVQENNYPWGGTATATDNALDGWNDFKCANEDNSYAVNVGTWPVGSFPAGASWCGAMDLAGNVWEWCADWYGDYSTTPMTNPTGPATGKYRVLRGGSWNDPGNYIRCAIRNGNPENDGNINSGFRCVSVSPGP